MPLTSALKIWLNMLLLAYGIEHFLLKQRMWSMCSLCIPGSTLFFFFLFLIHGSFGKSCVLHRILQKINYFSGQDMLRRVMTKGFSNVWSFQSSYLMKASPASYGLLSAFGVIDCLVLYRRNQYSSISFRNLHSLSVSGNISFCPSPKPALITPVTHFCAGNVLCLSWAWKPFYALTLHGEWMWFGK